MGKAVAMRRVLVGVVLLVLLANVAAITSGVADSEPVVVARELPGEELTTTTTSTTLPVTTTTIATAPTTARPIDPPKDPYAAEPHVVLGQIEIPKLGLNVPLNEGISLHSIDRGPSHWPGTAMPGSATGNVVVAGHRVTHTRPFRHIDDLVAGDEIIFTFNGVRSVYRVTGTQVVTPKQTEIVNQTQEPTATLFACHPPGSARYRYVIHAALASTSPA
jgi:sortase A